MKFVKYLSVTLLIPYLAFMFYREPQISDAVIIFSLCALLGFEKYMYRLENRDPPRSAEIDKLRDQLELEQIKSTIQNLQIQRNLAEARRDTLNAGAVDEQRKFRF